MNLVATKILVPTQIIYHPRRATFIQTKDLHFIKQLVGILNQTNTQYNIQQQLIVYESYRLT